MAAFKQHVTFSSVLGAGYACALGYLNVDWSHAALAGALCGISGMLPDLDSDSGRPVRELFSGLAVAVPLLFLRRWEKAGVSPDAMILLAGGTYLAVRFGAAWLFKHLTVHRGMFHSLPAAVIAAEIVYLAHDSPEPHGRLILAGGVLIGFLSHLVLDEIYSVDARGLRIRLNKAAGSALKLASHSVPATLLTWLILTGFTYLVGIESGYMRPVHWSASFPVIDKLSKEHLPARIPGPGSR